METKAQKQIIDYFSYFEEFYNTSRSCLKICQNCAISINKLICRCRNIKQAEVVGSPLEQFPGLQSKLLTSLHNLISEDIQEIQSQRSTIEDLFAQLCNKNRVLLETCKDIDVSLPPTLLVTGTPLQPSLKQILEFVADTISFGGEICGRIETSLNVLSFKGLNTDSLVDNFKITSNWQRKISDIIAYTSFCTENDINKRYNT